MTGPRIAVVDDDPAVRSLIRRALTGEGYEVDEAADEDGLLALLGRHRYACITLDLNLPGSDGLTIARRVRLSSKTPIVMVTGKGDVIDRVVGLEVGADDYLAKPFHIRELIARVRAVLRRTESDDTPPATLADAAEDGFALGPLTLLPARRILVGADGATIELTPGEYDILLALVRANGRPLTREALLDAGRGDGDAFDRAVDNVVARLRKKLPDGAIKTVRAVGYQLGVPVRPARLSWPPAATRN